MGRVAARRWDRLGRVVAARGRSSLSRPTGVRRRGAALLALGPLIVAHEVLPRHALRSVHRGTVRRL
ncbi:Haloalkane dehalogenase (fragment) [Nostocoides japonicum T1-X7]|uniref:Haloalkane dehalogenase n=1 Tax=Nostocoides japonicum T1-X7 TaxID=1194083 RepID=A0A077LUE0_9MICO